MLSSTLHLSLASVGSLSTTVVCVAYIRVSSSIFIFFHLPFEGVVLELTVESYELLRVARGMAVSMVGEARVGGRTQRSARNYILELLLEGFSGNLTLFDLALRRRKSWRGRKVANGACRSRGYRDRGAAFGILEAIGG